VRLLRVSSTLRAGVRRPAGTHPVHGGRDPPVRAGC